MPSDEFDPIESVTQLVDGANVKTATAGARLAGGKLLGGKISHGLNVATALVDTGHDDASTQTMADSLAGRLEMSTDELQPLSKLVSAARGYHKRGEALEDAAVDLAQDAAIAATTGGVGTAAKWAYDYFTAEDKADPGRDLGVVHAFVTTKEPVTREDVMTVVMARSSMKERAKIRKHYPRNGTGTNDLLMSKFPELLTGGDFNPEEQNAAQYLADKFNNGDLEKAVMVLDEPKWKTPTFTIENGIEVQDTDEISPPLGTPRLVGQTDLGF